jgi:tetratricopeptide (TPR) repeat protein
LNELRTAAGYEPQRHFLQGALLLREGQIFPALHAFGHSVNYAPLRVRTLTLSGQALYLAKRYQDAIRLLNQAVEADPNWIDAHRWLASAYYDLGLNEDAMEHLQRVAELDPSDPRPHRLMGLMHKDFEGFDLAVAAYLESLRRDPRQPDDETIRLELAESQIKLRRYEDAMQTLAQCPPSDARSVFEAECLYSLGKSDEARRRLQETLQRSPEHLPALMLSGTIELEQGNAAAAIETLSRAVTAYPKDYTARFKLAQAYRRAGNNELADQHTAEVDRLKAIRTEFAELHHVAAAEPNDAQVRCRLAELALELDRPDLAQVWYQAALAIDPTNEQAARGLGLTP